MSVPNFMREFVLYVYDVVIKSSRSLSHLMSFLYNIASRLYILIRQMASRNSVRQPDLNHWMRAFAWLKSLKCIIIIIIIIIIITVTLGHHVWRRTKISQQMQYTKLIRRWDSERELSLRRHRAHTTKYNRLVHKFRHRLTRLCVGTHVFTKFSEITQYNGHYVVQGHSRSPILVPMLSSFLSSVTS